MVYKRIFEHMHTAVVVVDASLNILQINPPAEVLLAVSAAQCIGNSLKCYVKVDPDTDKTFFRVVKEGQAYTRRRASWDIHNGERHIVDFMISPMNRVQSAVIEISVIDHLMRINREEALMSSHETTRNLVRSMAHEIKNPLGGIRGAAQLLARELDQMELREFTDIIISETDRLRNLVDRMLGPRKPANLKPLNIHEVLEHLITLMQSDGNDIKLIRDYDPSIPNVFGDKEQLIQALLNIVRNARQAINEANIRCGEIRMQTRITRHCTIGGHYHPLICRVSIIDNGPGIPEDLINDIFYPLITGRAEGTGLGLAITQNLIQQHNGYLECHSEPGQTNFSIYLPLEIYHEHHRTRLDH